MHAQNREGVSNNNNDEPSTAALMMMTTMMIAARQRDALEAGVVRCERARFARKREGKDRLLLHVC